MGGWSSSWVVLEWAAVALLAALVLPYLVPGTRRHRGGVVRIVLALAAGLALGAAAAGSSSTMDAPGRLLHLAAILALVCGLIGLAGLVLFDLILPPLRVDVPSLVRDVVQVAVAGVAVLACLRVAGFDVLPLLTTSAVLTAIVGLALQSTIANLFGGLSLQLDRTLEQGDWIETGSHSGRIVEIGWRSTRLLTRDGDTLFLPNSELLTGSVLNLSRPTGAHRVSVRLSLNPAHPPGLVRQTLADAIRDVPGVLTYPPPDCVIAEFAENGVVYAVRYWITEFEREGAIAGESRSRLWYAVRRAGFQSPATPSVIALRPEEAGREVAAGDHRERLAVLRDAAPLASLDDAAREQVATGMRRLDFAPGEAIVREGMPGGTLYVVSRGEVQAHADLDGATAETVTLRRGDVFGDLRDPHRATCVAATEVGCYTIDRETLEPLLTARPELAARLAATRAPMSA